MSTSEVAGEIYIEPSFVFDRSTSEAIQSKAEEKIPYTGVFTEWRPCDQHTLFKEDEHFDTRLKGLAKCKNYINDAYINTSKKLNTQLTNQLADDYLKAMDSRTHNIKVSAVITSLSNPDRNVFIDDTISELESRLGVLIAATEFDTYASAHDFYVKVTESYKLKISRGSTKVGRLNTNSKTHLRNTRKNSVLIQDAPLIALKYIISENSISSALNSIMIVVRHVERLHNHVFGEILEMIHNKPIKMHLVIFCSSQRSLPVVLEKSPRGLLCLSIRKTCDPLDFYDQFMGFVLGGCELPVSFPARIINWIHEKFWRSNNCVRSVAKR